MPFLAQERIHVPTKDILSWAHDGVFDRNKPLYIDATDPSHNISAVSAEKFIRKLIAGFRRAGLKQGDTVLIHSFNNIYYPIIVLGIIGFGGVFTGTNPSYTTSELQHQIQASAAKLIIAEPEILSSIQSAAASSGLPASKILILDSTKQSIPFGFQSWNSLLKHGENDWHHFNDEKISKDTPAMLLFSSGTTGLPKPAVLSHYNLVAQHTMVFEHKPRPYDLSRLIALPMFHAATAPSTHTSPMRSGHVQIIMRRFDTNAYLRHAETFQVTDLTLVPPMVTALVMSPIPSAQKQQRLRFVKCALAGAAPLDAKMQARFQALLNSDAPFTQIWAMTETSCFASVFDYPENDDTASVGRFVPNMDVKLIDDDGNDISGYNVRGELCVRAPTVIRGYLGVPQQNDFDSEGYFRTGDILYCDAATKLWYIVDRKKELIKVRGFQVAPAELEGMLLDHQAVQNAAVIGIPTKEGDSEMPRAYVVRKPGKELQEVELIKYLDGRLAKYKRLEGGVKFVDSIPTSASGKILKRLLREQARKEMDAKL
ncbi:acetyl-CoA synthetase-like protein [Polyplosphaeria fusca]|uniref:Acetyl-CoA synthetase-like protein n=1 Tax=Polyplosphaeria fusca TaxID=682080 RepID=A0A9P4VA92_9PLEO|nr:acetyl-CoA synthetase-like protein [Polyplosphaeria fusca]